MIHDLSPERRWHRRGPILVLGRWPCDVEILAQRLVDPDDAAQEIARVQSKRGVRPQDVEELRELAGVGT